MAHVKIEYCVPCGFRERAIDLTDEILQATEEDIDDLALVTGDHGVLRVSVDGETVYDKDEQGFDESEIASDVQAAI